MILSLSKYALCGTRKFNPSLLQKFAAYTYFVIDRLTRGVGWRLIFLLFVWNILKRVNIPNSTHSVSDFQQELWLRLMDYSFCFPFVLSLNVYTEFKNPFALTIHWINYNCEIPAHEAMTVGLDLEFEMINLQVMPSNVEIDIKEIWTFNLFIILQECRIPC